MANAHEHRTCPQNSDRKARLTLLCALSETHPLTMHEIEGLTKKSGSGIVRMLEALEVDGCVKSVNGRGTYGGARGWLKTGKALPDAFTTIPQLERDHPRFFDGPRFDASALLTHWGRFHGA